jgi:hypothetical protein
MMRGWADSGCDSGHGCLWAGRVCVEVRAEGPAVGGGVPGEDRARRIVGIHGGFGDVFELNVGCECDECVGLGCRVAN